MSGLRAFPNGNNDVKQVYIHKQGRDNTTEIFIPLMIYKLVQNKAWLRVYACEKAWLRKAGLAPLHMVGD